MRTRAIFTTVLTLSLTTLVACGDDDDSGDSGEAEVEFGTYSRLADDSFDSIEACETAQAEQADGALFNCAQILTLNEDGTYFSILTDIAEPGTWEIEDSTLVFTNELTESTTEVSVNDDGTLGDGWALDPDCGPTTT